jgi:hypothetical protein
VALRGAQTAVVGHEEDNRILSQLKAVECIENLAHRLIHRLNHPGINGVLLNQPNLSRALLPPDLACLHPFAFLLVLGFKVRASHQRRMHRVE